MNIAAFEVFSHEPRSWIAEGQLFLARRRLNSASNSRDIAQTSSFIFTPFNVRTTTSRSS